MSSLRTSSLIFVTDRLRVATRLCGLADLRVLWRRLEATVPALAGDNMTGSALNLTDVSLWQLTCRDDRQAFEELVRRHQSVVSAVAYNGCGDLTQSEDIAQETFWAAWRERAALLDPTRLRAWLCGIARNLARNSNRRAAKAASQLDESHEPIATTREPVDEAVSREEETLVWEALAEIPENYREPLILFYREHQSVTEVAEALELSSDAVKQRLSRGREMLREQVATVVEGALRRSRPQAGFTVAVMAGLTAMSAGTKAALAATTGVGAATAVAGAGGAAVAMKAAPAAAVPGAVALASTAGLAGGLFGSAVGLAGGWFGMWLPAQFAPTNRERLYHLMVGRRMLVVSAVMTLLLAGLMIVLATRLSPSWMMGCVFGWIVVLNVYIAVEILLLVRTIKRIRAESPPESDPNDSPVKAYFQQRATLANGASRWEGRVYRSRSTLLGLPLIDINVSDPAFTPNSSQASPPPPRHARGWIAIGDRADGMLLAIGGVARGFFAFGGLAMGIVSGGGVSLGLISFGGLAVGALAVGGGALGGIALGGMAIGWQAAGGGAIAWDVACGGGAVAYHAAFGGGAMAHDFAVGGGVSALHANDDLAKAFLENHWLVRGMKWYTAHNALMTVAIVVLSILPGCLITPLMYRRRPPVASE